MRQSGSNRYVWTMGSWLLYEYLEQASPEDRRRTETALSIGFTPGGVDRHDVMPSIRCAARK